MNTLEMTNKEIIEEVNRLATTDINPKYRALLEGYKLKIENDFNAEWSKKPLKWLFTKYRQRKLKSQIMRRYMHPIFSVVEDCLEEIWSKMTNEFIENLVSVEDMMLGDPEYFEEENHNA